MPDDWVPPGIEDDDAAPAPSGQSFHEREVVDLMALAMLPDAAAREPLFRHLLPHQSPAPDATVYQRLVSEKLVDHGQGGWLKRSPEGQRLVTEFFARVR